MFAQFQPWWNSPSCYDLPVTDSSTALTSAISLRTSDTPHHTPWTCAYTVLFNKSFTSSSPIVDSISLPQTRSLGTGNYESRPERRPHLEQRRQWTPQCFPHPSSLHPLILCSIQQKVHIFLSLPFTANILWKTLFVAICIPHTSQLQLNFALANSLPACPGKVSVLLPDSLFLFTPSIQFVCIPYSLDLPDFLHTRVEETAEWSWGDGTWRPASSPGSPSFR